MNTQNKKSTNNKIYKELLDIISIRIKSIYMYFSKYKSQLL